MTFIRLPSHGPTLRSELSKSSAKQRGDDFAISFFLIHSQSLKESTKQGKRPPPKEVASFWQ